MYSSHTPRVCQIDLARGGALVLMVVFHLIVDLKDFYHYDVEYLSGFWYYEGKLSAILFLLIAGVSSTLNRRCLRHGLQVFAWGMAISLVTYFYNPMTYIRFGILHLIGCALLIAPWAKRTPHWILLLCIVIALWAGRLVAGMTNETGLLLPLGIMPSLFETMDFYPLFPWLAVFWSGISLSRLLHLPTRPSRPGACPRPLNVLAACGRHSLAIYLVHQPLMLLLLFLFLK